jgi:hypothetical protein
MREFRSHRLSRWIKKVERSKAYLSGAVFAQQIFTASPYIHAFAVVTTESKYRKRRVTWVTTSIKPLMAESWLELFT